MADAVVAEIRGAGGKAVASHDSVATSAGGEAICSTARVYDGSSFARTSSGRGSDIHIFTKCAA